MPRIKPETVNINTISFSDFSAILRDAIDDSAQKYYRASKEFIKEKTYTSSKKYWIARFLSDNMTNVPIITGYITSYLKEKGYKIIKL